MKVASNLLAFNRGLISPLALARIDLKRTALSAEIMTNWMPRVLGSMMLRPGLEYKHSTKDNAFALHIPFVFAVDDTAIVELTANSMRVMGTDEQIVAYAAVDTSITNGGFTTDLTGWTDEDEGTSASDWTADGMRLVGTGTQYARRRQVVTVAAGDQNDEHALILNVTRGSGRLKVGSTAGGAEYLSVSLVPGRYSLAFTPTGDFHIELASLTAANTTIREIAVAAAGDMVVPTPWGEDVLAGLRYDQSGDVIFVAGGDTRQRRIERYGTRSWAVVEYRANDGPFRGINLSTTTMTPTALSGTTTLTASAAFFEGDHVGALLRLSSTGQRIETDFTGNNQWSEPLRIAGVGNGRKFEINRTGTWAGTIRVQRSVSAPGDWVTMTLNYTTSGTSTYDDELDNQIIYYRIGMGAADYTSGTAETRLTSGSGSIRGLCRVAAVTSPTAATVDVLIPFGNLTATLDWWEGVWSTKRGWPSAVSLFDGRLWWAGQDRVWGSVSDAFSTFDDETEGDSGPIARSIGAGPVDTINWLLPLGHLLIGTQGAERVAKSSSFDEPLTPSQFRLTPVSTQGSAAVRAVPIDTTGVFVQRNGSRLYELLYDGGAFSYSAKDLTAIVPDIGRPGVVRLGVQRQPDTRLHCVRSDGRVAILVFDSAEEVTCWILFETDGYVEDVVVLPGPNEDAVYYVVRREIDASTVRYLERWATEAEARGATVTKLADACKRYSGAPATVIPGLEHLEGEFVAVWADGADVGVHEVSAGAITLSTAASEVIVGLTYAAQFKSAKLAHSLKDGTVSLTQRQRIDHVGLILADTHPLGLRYGQDFDTMDDLPLMERHAPIDPGVVHEAYDEDSIEVNGTWTTDARICLEAASPRPCTLLACIVGGTMNMKG